MSQPLSRGAVRVPSSTSNLGSGYDTLGLALRRYLTARFEPDESGELRVLRSGSLASLEEDPSKDLVAVAMSRVLDAEGRTPSGTLTLESDIPVARGLGSSAAAVLAGYDLARQALGLGRDDDGAFATALGQEGHGDNAAPCLFGGLRAVSQTPEGPVVVPLPLSPEIGFAYAAPAGRISTREAREILPARVSHRVAAHALGRLVALVRGLETGDRELLQIGLRDELHVPHRLGLIPGATAAISAGLDAGAWAITVSGAGSGLIAVCDPADATGIGLAMRESFDAGRGDPECVGFPVLPCAVGLTRVAADGDA